MQAASAAQPRHQLLKILGVTFGVAVAVGNTVGAGILRSPSIIAGEVPGFALIVGLWVLGGLQAALGANIFAEMATAMPLTGGLYVYAQRALGDIGGLLVGWSVWASKLAGAAATSISFAAFLPMLWPAAGAHTIAVACALQLAIYAANIFGLREGRTVQNTTSMMKAAMLFLFIAAAFIMVAPPEVPGVLSSSVVFKWANIVVAFQLIRGAYSGYDAPLYFSGENTDPVRSIPRAIFLGLLLTGVLYVGVNIALLHALGTHGVASSPLPFTIVLDRMGGRLPSLLFAVGAMVTVASCTNAIVMSAPRILFAMANDGLLPKALAYLNAGGSPIYAFAMTAVGSLALAMTGAFVLVFGLIGTLDTVSGVLIEVSYFLLRFREPGLKRAFRAIGYPVLPALLLVIDVTFMGLLIFADHLGTAVAVGLGLLCIPLALIARRNRAKSA